MATECSLDEALFWESSSHSVPYMTLKSIHVNITLKSVHVKAYITLKSIHVNAYMTLKSIHVKAHMTLSLS